MSSKENIISVIGLGYVGLPLALEFSKKNRVIGFDLSQEKVNLYNQYIDPAGEINSNDISKQLKSGRLSFTTNADDLKSSNFYIVAVPTPVNGDNSPNFTALNEASAIVGKNLKKGSTVIFESTVYPGATEEICIPIIEKYSGLKWMKEFNIGYSPERINPGDKNHTLKNTIKIVSGDSKETTEIISNLYGEIVDAGIYIAESIKVAEAAKVIENIQRDLNISLMNELAIIFNKIGIDTSEVIQAAGSKWNFLKFNPGLVGGHCIGVDPYYLTYKAELLGYIPQVILAGRRINDGMASYIAKMTVQNIILQGGCNAGDTVIILGFSFKENCVDIRNTKVANLIESLSLYGLNVIVHDPVAHSEEVFEEYGINLTPWEHLPNSASAVIVAVSHQQFLDIPVEKILSLLKKNGVFIDVKSVFNSKLIKELGYVVWRL